MKRYRIFAYFDFDSRSLFLTEPIQDEWDEQNKLLHQQNRESTIKRLKDEFGETDSEQKIQSFVDLGQKPFSVISFHNSFFAQVRNSFVVGSYYPALTGACSLGERILNHLVLTLRDDYKATPEYKKVHRSNSFDNWTLAIDVLTAWGVLLPKVALDFRRLQQKRNEAIHFRPEVDGNARKLALEAVSCLQQIIGEQFAGFGPQPWFITGIPGEIYIKKEWETKPFIRKVYLPNGLLVGTRHRIDSVLPKIQVIDPDLNKEGAEISDEEFRAQRNAFNDLGQASGGNS